MSRAPFLVLALLALVLLPAVPASSQALASQDDAAPMEGRPEAASGAAAAGDERTNDEPSNGFDLANLLVPRELVVAGGPGRDGIRSVDEPSFVPPEEATWVGPTTTVLGVEVGGEARAYPVHLLEYHQIVNDVIAGKPVAVTYDPISGVPRAFSRRVGERTLEFGVSGLLYNANFLMYDRETQSLWSQLEGRAVAGPLAGTLLDPLRIRQEARDAWLSRFPESVCLERPERMRIDYRYSPFKVYWTTNRIPFPVQSRDERFHAKELVVGVSVDGTSRAYLGSIVTAHGGAVEDELRGRKISLRYDSENAFYVWEVPDDVAVVEAYWFAWKAFRPDTEIWNESSAAPPAKP